MLARTVVPIEIERWEVRRARELREDLRLYDAAIASITADIGKERREAGLAFFEVIPAALKTPRWLALQSGLNQLSRWHSETLREYAGLV